MNNNNNNPHYSQVEPLGNTDWTITCSVSQFVSLDAEGIAIFWCSSNNDTTHTDSDTSYEDMVKNEKNKDANNYISTKNDKIDPKNPNFENFNSLSRNEYGLSPKGRISLVLTKIINRNISIPKAINSTGINKENVNGNNKNKIVENEFSFTNTVNSPAISVLSPVPNDVSTLLLSGNNGKVSKIVRFGEPSAPRDFSRPSSGKMEISVLNRCEEFFKWNCFLLI
jgi:hypothetical protein